MFDLTLIIHSPGGTREVAFAGERMSIGNDAATATIALADESLLPLHASINRAGGRVWVLDEGLGGDCYVNGARVPASGSPLRDGDELALGDSTMLSISLRPRDEHAKLQTTTTLKGALRQPRYVGLALGLAVTLLAALVLSSFASRSGVTTTSQQASARSSDSERVAAERWRDDSERTENFNAALVRDVLPATEFDGQHVDQAGARIHAAPLYVSMTVDERDAFVAREAQHIARRIGNREAAAFTPEVLQRIERIVDAYAARARLSPPSLSRGCRFGQSLPTLLARARLNAPFINRVFNERGLSPVVGLYLAMIESEFCVCPTSPTGPKGMFQFTRATATTYGLRVLEPEERCEPEKAARAAAQYMKALIGRYGTGPLSVPLAVASYNSGEGDLSRNLFKALDAVRQSENPERSFWTLVANEHLLTDQFQRENIKYVPKFFAAAIVGENPRAFGVELEPLSTYSE